MNRSVSPYILAVLFIFAIISIVQHPIHPIDKTPEISNACFWDRDTLATEASGFPGITEIITGRFDRFPDLYYQMRIDRVQPELEADPRSLNLYDDIAVAHDRIGNHTIAIEWMEKKRSVLDELSAQGMQNQEHEYRYLANLGTFYIHRWLNNGASQTDLADAEEAYRLIEAAITLNPDAHFGRERYQLLAIKWILNGYNHNENYWAQPSIVDAIDRIDHIGYDDAIEGFSGLIALGNAWESVDVFYALSLALRDQKHTSVYLLCQLRIKELITAGNRSLTNHFDHAAYQSVVSFDQYPIHAEITTDYLKELGNTYFPDARNEADNWVYHRQAYIESRLKLGEHPDTHPDFWAQWIESSSPPQMPDRIVYPSKNLLFGFSFGVVLMVTLIAMIFFFKVIKSTRKRLRTKPV